MRPSHLFVITAALVLVLLWAWSHIPDHLPWRLPEPLDPWIVDPYIGELCDVVEVEDANTLLLDCIDGRYRVHHYCVQALGLDQEPWGRHAHHVVHALITDTVRLVYRRVDDDGSVVGEVFSYNPDDPEDTENIGLALVLGGNAAVPLDSCDEPMYRVAQDQARETGAGIWRDRGAHQRPWEFRQR